MAKPPNPLQISLTINSQISQTLASLRHPTLETPNPRLLHSLLSLRSLLFPPLPSLDPTSYLSPFLDIIQSQDIPAPTTSIALHAIRKIIKLELFNAQTPGARDAIHAVVSGVANCHIETNDDDSADEELVLLGLAQLLKSVARCEAFALLDDAAVRSIVSTSYEIVQQAKGCGAAREAMRGVVGRVCERGNVVDVVWFLVRVLDEEEELGFGVLMVNDVVGICGEGLGRWGGVLGVVQDEVFGRLVYYGTRCGVDVFSLICDVVFNLYCFARRLLFD